MLRKINTSMQLSLQIKVIYLQGSPKKKNKNKKTRGKNASECFKFFRESTNIGLKLVETTFKSQNPLLVAYLWLLTHVLMGKVIPNASISLKLDNA